MSKITLNSIGDLTQSATAQTTINTDFATIQTAFDNTLSRDGTSPNQMNSNLDMNSNQILNLPAPVSGSSPARLVDVISNPTLVLTIPTVGTSGATVPLLNTNNTFSGNNTFTGTDTFSNTSTFNGATSFSNSVTFTGTLSGLGYLTPEQFGAVGNGVANDTAALVSLFAAANSFAIVQFKAGSTYLTDPITISQTNVNVPYRIEGNGAKLKARASSANPLITFENVQGVVHNFGFNGFTLDANGLHAYCMKIHGSQQASFTNIRAINGTSGGVWLLGEPGFGIYYNTLMNIESELNTGAGFTMKSINNTGQYFIAADTFLGLRAAGNTTFGYDLDYCSAGFFDCEAETNGTTGVNIDHSIQLDFIGLYTEANHSPDSSFTGTANSTGVRVVGGRMPGTITSTLLTGVSNFWSTSDASAQPINWIAGTNLTSTGLSLLTTTSVPAGGTSGLGVKLSSTTNLGVFFGSGVPTLSAAQGSLYIRTDGSSTSTRMYINTTGSTTWTNVTTAA